jgi:hypothetical protein
MSVYLGDGVHLSWLVAVGGSEKLGAVVTCRHGEHREVLFQDGESEEDGAYRLAVEDPVTIFPSFDTGCCRGNVKEGVWKPL